MKYKKIFSSAMGLAILLSLSAPATAYAALDLSNLTVEGKNLDKATVDTSFTAHVSAPSGVESVKFVLDGKYLGEDKRAPFSWDIKTGEGPHKLKVRDGDNSSARLVANFSAKGKSVPSTPPIEPSPEPVTPAAPPINPALQDPTVSTAEELEKALTSVESGSTIVLADGIYTGNFEASANGSAGNPIQLVGSENAILTTGDDTSGYGLHITGDYWHVRGISVKESGKGIVLDSSVGSVLDGVDVGFIGNEGVHFRQNSSNGQIIHSTVHDTGTDVPDYGEGIYVGSANSNWGNIMGSSDIPDETNNVQIKNNRISNTTAEGIDIKEGTSGGVISGNVFHNAGYSGAHYGDSWVDVKGDNYSIVGNSGNDTKLDAFQVHGTIDSYGQNNYFADNNVTSGVPGYLVNVSTNIKGTIIECQPTKAESGISNIACQE